MDLFNLSKSNESDNDVLHYDGFHSKLPLLWTLLTHGCSQESSVVSCCHSRSSLLPTPCWFASRRTAISPPKDSKRRTENSSHQQMPLQQTRHPVALREMRKQARYSGWCTQERRTRRRRQVSHQLLLISLNTWLSLVELVLVKQLTAIFIYGLQKKALAKIEMKLKTDPRFTIGILIQNVEKWKWYSTDLLHYSKYYNIIQ